MIEASAQADGTVLDKGLCSWRINNGLTARLLMPFRPLAQ